MNTFIQRNDERPAIKAASLVHILNVQNSLHAYNTAQGIPYDMSAIHDDDDDGDDNAFN